MALVVRPHCALNLSLLYKDLYAFFLLLFCQNLLPVTNLMQFFMYLFTYFISPHVSSIKCLSSGDRIVHHLVWLVCVSDCLVCWSGGKCISSRILANNQLDALFPVFIYFISLHVSSIKCSSSGDRIVLTHHLVWLVCVSDCLVCWSGGNCISSKILVNNQLDALFPVFIYFISLHVSSIKCSSSGDRIVLIHHLVWLVCVSDCLVCRSGGNCSSFRTAIPSSHLKRLTIPDDVLI